MQLKVRLITADGVVGVELVAGVAVPAGRVVVVDDDFWLSPLEVPEVEALRLVDEPWGVTVNSLLVQAAQSEARTRIAPKARLRLSI